MTFFLVYVTIMVSATQLYFILLYTFFLTLTAFDVGRVSLLSCETSNC